jgi:FtsP/CotA-like multicopper oxidase with cupredoxin domain
MQNMMLPVDTTLMGAGMGPNGGMEIYTQNRADIHLHGGFTPWISDGTPHQWITPASQPTSYPRAVNAINVPDMTTNGTSPCAATGNRAACITPSPTDGLMTYYWTNQQSSRLMFYHDHAYGITRLNVYAGVAAGYLLVDSTEEALVAAGTLPNQAGLDKTVGATGGGVYRYGIPLVIQDKTFVNTTTVAPAGFTGVLPATTAVNDPLWATYMPKYTAGGQLWYPHEYMPNENIYDPTGFNSLGRWDYGPFMSPPLLANNIMLPSPTIIPEQYGDTPIINGAPYPYITLPNPVPARFRILSTPNERVINLQFYYAADQYGNICKAGAGGVITPTKNAAPYTTYGGVTGFTITAGGTGYVPATPPTVTIGAPNVAGGVQATATAIVTGTAVTGFTITAAGAGYTTAPTVTIAAPAAGTTATATATIAAPVVASVPQIACTEVAMVPAAPPMGAMAPQCTTATNLGGAFAAIAAIDASGHPINGTGLPLNGAAVCTPTTWPIDGRPGGVPDPASAGPPIIQIGTEGGLLPAAAVIPSQPIDFEYNRRAVTIMDTKSHALLMAPAERADVIVDFTSVPAGSTLMLYNDGPAPTPLYDPRNDYFTNDPDQSISGGAPTTVAGWGPNTRTLMQINIAATGVAGTPVNITALNTALAKAYGATQPKPVVPNSVYDPAFGTVTTTNAHVQNPDVTLNLTGKPQTVAQIITTGPGTGYTTAPTVTFIGGGCTTMPTATANLNGVGGVTITTSGSGYITAPAVIIGPPNVAGGIQATAIAQISGGVVSAINMLNLGSGYTTTPTVTIGAPTGPPPLVTALATATVAVNTVGQITLNTPGTGCTSAPYVFLQGGNGTAATASAVLTGDTILDSIGIAEGFDVEYGRMNVTMATAPNLLNPNAIAPVAGAIPGYMDPPSDYWFPGQNKVFRVTHIGADSHGLHLHLGNFQVVNRVDWTNTYMPPDPNEFGWKDTIRTYPFTDLVLASNIPMMWLPFQLPTSNRLLDVTSPAGSSANFPAAPPVAGQIVPAALTNVITNFGWEYVYHCHYLDHEENDMMRPMVFSVSAPGTPTGLAATVPTASSVVLTWTGSTSAGGYVVQRTTVGGGPTVSFNVKGTTPTFTDTSVVTRTRYSYRVQATNPAGSSAWSASLAVATVVPPTITASGSTLGGTMDTNSLTWTQPQTVSSFTIQKAFTPAFAAPTNYTVSGTTKTWSQPVARGSVWYYRIVANVGYAGGTMTSAPSAFVKITAP